jgi:hypothetical protein
MIVRKLIPDFADRAEVSMTMFADQPKAVRQVSPRNESTQGTPR